MSDTPPLTFRDKIGDSLYSLISKFFPKKSVSSEVQISMPPPEDLVVLRQPPELSTSARLLVSLLSAGVTLAVGLFAVKYLLQVLDPTLKDKKNSKIKAEELLNRLGIKQKDVQLDDYELCLASNLVDPQSLSTSWDDIGGLDGMIQDIRQTIILPFRRPDLYTGSSLFQAPKGLLLYGPPGCGKTMLARAIARDACALFINLQVTSIVDKWYGESHKKVEAVFSLAKKLQPIIIFIDEIDSFLRSRSDNDHEATALIKTQFMTFWDGLASDTEQRIMIVGATNRPETVDVAILRRMPLKLHVKLPSKDQIKDILIKILSREMVHTEVFRNLDKLAALCEGKSGSDVREMCREVVVLKMRTLIEQHGFNEDMNFQATEKELSLADFLKVFNRQGNSGSVESLMGDAITLD